MARRQIPFYLVNDLSNEDLVTALVKVGRRANIMARELEESGIPGVTSKGSAYGALQLGLGNRKRIPEKRSRIEKLSQSQLRRYLAMAQTFTKSESATVAGYRAIQERQIKTLMTNTGMSRKAAEMFRSIMATMPAGSGYSPEAITFAEAAVSEYGEGGERFSEQEIIDAYRNAFDVADDELDIQKAYDALGIDRYANLK